MVTNGSPSIYTVRITLDDTKPPVWRTFQVRGNITLAGFRDVAVAVMGWSGYHMHLWRAGRKQYGVIHDDDFMNMDSVLDENDVRLCDAVPKMKGKLRLVYDMGDGWEHMLQVVEIGARSAGRDVPRLHERGDGLSSGGLRRAVGLVRQTRHPGRSVA